MSPFTAARDDKSAMRLFTKCEGIILLYQNKLGCKAIVNRPPIL